MTETDDTYTTRDGWTIARDRTPAAHARHLLEYADSHEAEVAAFYKISLEELHCRLEDYNLPEEPAITPEITAILAKPPLDMDSVLQITGEGTEADLLRLCAFTIGICRDYMTLDYLKGNTFYEPPSLFEDRYEELREAVYRALAAVSAIPSVSLVGVCAKARLAAEWGVDDDCADLGTDIVQSVLEDIGFFDQPKSVHPALFRHGETYTPRKKTPQFIEASAELERIWCDPAIRDWHTAAA